MKLQKFYNKIVLKPLFWAYKVIRREFCKHDYTWIRNVYGDEIYMSGKFKRSWWRCKKCGVFNSTGQLHEEDNFLT